MSKLPVVMVSGHFDPFHDGHLDYLEQARAQFGFSQCLICVISSDAQLIMKKGRVNIPEEARRRIVRLILVGLHVSHRTLINIYDTDTTLVANALRALEPHIFFRGGDKTLETMPVEEYQVCKELGIKIKHAKLVVDRHGSKMEL